jgi:hypothetical protein
MKNVQHSRICCKRTTRSRVRLWKIRSVRSRRFVPPGRTGQQRCHWLRWLPSTPNMCVTCKPLNQASASTSAKAIDISLKDRENVRGTRESCGLIESLSEGVGEDRFEVGFGGCAYTSSEDCRKCGFVPRGWTWLRVRVREFVRTRSGDKDGGGEESASMRGGMFCKGLGVVCE